MSNPKPLVSALIPAHNCEAFVGEAIASVLAQTYEPLECVVIDDGSTDRTVEVISGFGEQITRLGQPNRGPAAARNAAARAARGEFLAFLDADDIWEPTKIERQMDLFRAHPELGLVYCSLRLIDESGRPLEVAPGPDPEVVLRNVLLNISPSVGLGSTGLVRRHAFCVAGAFDERLSRGDDSDLTWRLAVRFPLGTVREPLVRYRQHPDQIHRNVARWEHEWKLVLQEAFGSNLLPDSIQVLERPARANLALTVAYLQRSNHRLRAAKLCEAFWLSPSCTIEWITRSGRRRLRRLSSEPG